MENKDLESVYDGWSWHLCFEVSKLMMHLHTSLKGDFTKVIHFISTKPPTPKLGPSPRAFASASLSCMSNGC